MLGYTLSIRKMDTLYTLLVSQVKSLPFSDPQIWSIYDDHTWVNLIQTLFVHASPLSKQSDQKEWLQTNFHYEVTHVLDSSSKCLQRDPIHLDYTEEHPSLLTVPPHHNSKQYHCQFQRMPGDHFLCSIKIFVFFCSMFSNLSLEAQSFDNSFDPPKSLKFSQSLYHWHAEDFHLIYIYHLHLPVKAVLWKQLLVFHVSKTRNELLNQDLGNLISLTP